MNGFPVCLGTCGCFDYDLREGHKALLAYAIHISNNVTVFLVDDNTILRLKGRKPYYSQTRRAFNLYYAGVDNVVFLDGVSDFDIILSFPITHYLLGPDQNTEFDQALEHVFIKKGVQVIKAPVAKTHSTSRILDGLRE